MSSKTVLALGAIVIVLGLVLVFTPNETQTPQQEPQPAQEEQNQMQEGTTTIEHNEQQNDNEGTTTDAAADANADDENAVAATVEHSAQGFSPETVTVQVGDTVRFESSTGNMWVGVDEHPTHTQYDGSTTQEHCPNADNTTFDQCDTGSTYEFTFEKAGEWDYHNHVRSSQTGTIVVEPAQ